MSVTYPENPQTQPYRPSDADLRKQALDYYRQVKPKVLRQMRKDGELEEVLDLKVAATKRRAASLMESGTHESQAWFWAIREVISELERD